MTSLSSSKIIKTEMTETSKESTLPIKKLIADYLLPSSNTVTTDYSTLNVPGTEYIATLILIQIDSYYTKYKMCYCRERQEFM